MTGIMNTEKNGHTITWFVENYSYCWHKNRELLYSPYFTADGLEGTAWLLRLYPRGDREKVKGYISLRLYRSSDDDGPENFPLTYEMSILAADGSTLVSTELRYTFKRGISYGLMRFLQIDEVLLRRKSDYLPQDILTVRCKLWKSEGNLQQVTQISARTRIGIEKISFLHVTDGFSTLEPNQKQTVQIRSPPKEEYILSSSMYISDCSCCDGKIMVEITSSNSKQILSKCKLYLLDASGTVIKCGEADNRYDAERKGIQKLPLSLTRQLILSRKSDYLPDDKLSLICDCIFSSGVEYEKIERIWHEIPPAALNQVYNNDKNEDNTYNAAEKLSACPSALDDLKSVYNNRLLTDVELKTKTKSFPAHKIVLCGRSPIFKAMMTNDMKERNTDCIQIDDLEDDIVQQFLSFLYSDNLENLQWESAIKLYYASDKYEVEKLKVICSSFLVDNLSTSTAGELLLLADTHSDTDLKKAVEDFIFKHEEQVFSSHEWENLIETNAELVSKTMLLKYKSKMSVSQQ
ncbi:Speckle-type POZ protein [Araneus ventricosus]|uniref:Speckle-type POZ protein n=1 Tax=Araneus ventricosus TaxID=182803 RepID=A0A4Y2RX31_ARAVE|nr:Speckle-type POZ protein [Araneus ventricosus]GBN80423.1 Speckle-type POZ protein [Araneus ventricosus]